MGFWEEAWRSGDDSEAMVCWCRWPRPCTWTEERGRVAARNRTERRDTGNARSDALVERRVESGRMLEGRTRHVEWR